jgi:sigma-B regulation protein RsbU (phosphoserine phosphatase)
MSPITMPVDLGLIEKLREEELEEARSIQSGMLPTEPLNRGGVRISHEFQPIAEVGGDFLDYFELGDGCIGLYLGDVSGKGLPAAMFAALAVGTLRGVHKTGQSPATVLSTLNRRLLLRGASRRHAAMQYAVFDPRTNQMQVSSAGMPGPFHLSPQGCRVMEIQGMPPGLLDPSVEYETQKITIGPGDSVLFFTDGISDAFSMDGESFGIERLQVVCEAYRESPPPELLGHVFSEIEVFAQGRAQHDDMAAALFRLETA